MTAANGSRSNAQGLPPALRTGQAAIHLPEVQTMLRRLSAYELGIFMPHRHDERTGEFQSLPDDVVQVESGLEVSFQPFAKIANQTERFLPVGSGALAHRPLQPRVKWFVKKGRAAQSAPSNTR